MVMVAPQVAVTRRLDDPGSTDSGPLSQPRPESPVVADSTTRRGVLKIVIRIFKSGRYAHDVFFD
jgi:hypothetical protein